MVESTFRVEYHDQFADVGSAVFAETSTDLNVDVLAAHLLFCLKFGNPDIPT